MLRGRRKTLGGGAGTLRTEGIMLRGNDETLRADGITLGGNDETLRAEEITLGSRTKIISSTFLLKRRTDSRLFTRVDSS